MQVTCIRDCIYQGILVKVGDVIDVAGDVVPSRHFVKTPKPGENRKIDMKAEQEKSKNQHVEDLRKQIKEKGGTYDTKWGITRLQQQLFNLACDTPKSGKLPI